MKLLILKSTDPYLNLAIEEYLFKYTEDDIFMLWQNEPTVVIGKNQNAYVEINREYTEPNNIHIARRITGGGAVYHDLGNVNYTFISSRQKKEIDFEYFTKPIITALHTLGVNAELSGRNDITVDGKKISGNAQHSTDTRTLHHGTLLFDSDLSVLSSALNVDIEKMKSKAISSTRSRVTNIRSLLKEDYTTSQFIEALKRQIIVFYNPQLIVAPKNQAINELYIRNKSDEWIYPKNSYVSKYEEIKKGRFDFGGIEAHIELQNETVIALRVFGDFFGNKPISEIEVALQNTLKKDIKKKLSTIDVSEYISGMTNEAFIDFIIK